MLLLYIELPFKAVLNLKSDLFNFKMALLNIAPPKIALFNVKLDLEMFSVWFVNIAPPSLARLFENVEEIIWELIELRNFIL